MFLLWTLLFTPILAGETTSQHYHIVPDSSTDLCQHYQAGSCLTLDQLSSQLSETGDITLSFLPGDHLLAWDLSISGANNVTFSSEMPKNSSHILPRISCSEGKGIRIENTKSFTMEWLTICECRGKLISPVLLSKTLSRIKNCIFINNSVAFNGGALSIKGDHQCCSVIIESCSFYFNKALGSSAYSGSGGALLLRYGSTSIVNTTFIGNTGALEGGAIQGKYLHLSITACAFNNNTAVTGGSVMVGQDSVLLSSSNVYLHNTAFEGGAVYSSGLSTFDGDIFGGNSAQKGSAINLKGNLTLINCNFTDNGGGEGTVYSKEGTVRFVGFNMLLNNYNPLYAYYSEVLLIGRTLFLNNTGESGGAITCVGSSLSFQDTSETVVSGNQAVSGGGIYLEQSTVFVSDVYLLVTENTAEVAGGGIYALQSTIQFGMYLQGFEIPNNGDIIVININRNVAQKYGGGVYLSKSNMKIVNRHVSICGNIARSSGGGMYFQSSGVLLKSVLNRVYLTLRSNSALKGGGVFVADDGNKALCVRKNENTCFLHTIILFVGSYNSPSSMFMSAPLIAFGNNTAVEAGSEMYGGLLDRCTIRLVSTSLSDTRYFNGLLILRLTAGFYWAYCIHCHWTPYGRVQRVSQFFNHISSDPVRVCFCENNVINCNSTHPTVFKRKGERFTLSLVATDQVGKPVNATIISSLTSRNGNIGRFKEGQQSRRIDDRCTELDYQVYSSDIGASVELYAQGPCDGQGISKQVVDVTFLPCTCPVGLERVLSDIDCSCDCDKRLAQFVSNCSTESGIVQVNANVWIKYTNSSNTTDYIIHDCPFDYCVTKPVNVSLIDQDEQCAFNRSGTLCGECEQGLSLVFASSQCQQCSNYYLFLLLPFALAGVALVAFILVLNMTVAKGTIHGLIFYANILAANQSIFLPFDFPNFLTVFISWLNLDLGVETCFYNGMDSYGSLMLQLVFPAYVFLLIAMIMVLCDRSQKIAGWLSKRNPEATLYTLALLSYSKLTRLIVIALQFTTISYPDGTKETVWLYDANVPYFTASHIPRFIAAVIITLVGTVYITLLLFGQLFNRCSGYRLMKWTTHKYYIHFLKAHHAPFSDKHRYWVGLLLLVRLAHHLISAFASDSIINLSAIFLTLFLILYKLVSRKIYVTRWLDSLESLFLANLTVLGIATLFNAYSDTSSQKVLALVSMSVTFIAFFGLVLYCTLHSCGFKPSKIPWKALTTLCQKHSEHRGIQAEDISESSEDEPLLDFQSDLSTDSRETDPDRYITPPIIRSAVRHDQLREPALDDLSPVTPEDYVPLGRPQQRVRQMVTFAEIGVRGKNT